MTEAWLARTAADHLAIDSEIRKLLAHARQLDYPETVRADLRTRRAARSGEPSITMAASEARILLRGAMPILPQRRRARARHARLFAALSVFTSRLPSLALDPVDKQVLAAARQLATALDSWIGELAWRSATAAAGVSWPAPEAITTILQQPTAAPVPDLFTRTEESSQPEPQKPAAGPPPAAPRPRRQTHNDRDRRAA